MLGYQYYHGELIVMAIMIMFIEPMYDDYFLIALACT